MFANSQNLSLEKVITPEERAYLSRIDDSLKAIISKWKTNSAESKKTFLKVQEAK